MGGYHLSFTHPHYLLFVFLVVLCSSVRTLGDAGACANAFCGEGKCVLSNSTINGYDCVCNKGWQKVTLGSIISCALPNCTLDFTCGSGAPPPPPPPLLPPPFNLSNPCNFVLCGDGTCAVNGTGHYCQCNPGSSNLLNSTALLCIQKCSLGLDCNALLGLSTPPPPPPSKGSEKISKKWSSCMVLLSTIILAWIGGCMNN